MDPRAMMEGNSGRGRKKEEEKEEVEEGRGRGGGGGGERRMNARWRGGGMTALSVGGRELHSWDGHSLAHSLTHSTPGKPETNNE
ncbi:hypothetical protein BO71DRAFT_396368 [Aspergillus ellipticus CBS 707.79]|uniref:Uncharacterized protein n=1 Tax=Aspergillus ellipticus CBS 707.79 TaxID=1448320 RepID=A0A319DIA1_9EURO|nr:hypothetical protein BO71DRAFT_396368 [Aspergillus ellipticus CBS 707.79]